MLQNAMMKGGSDASRSARHERLEGDTSLALHVIDVHTQHTFAHPTKAKSSTRNLQRAINMPNEIAVTIKMQHSATLHV
jgi:hypothetical protein